MLALPATVLASTKCVLPEPDGGDMAPSKPNLVGVLTEVKEAELLVRQLGNGRTRRVSLATTTVLASEYGGRVERAELTQGHSVSVWYVGCASGGPGTPVAAYVRYSTASKKP